MAQEIEKKTSLAEMSLEELAAELARVPETSEEASMYHDEIIRRHSQTTLDTTTAQLEHMPAELNRGFSIVRS